MRIHRHTILKLFLHLVYCSFPTTTTANKILIEIMYEYSADLNYDGIIRRLSESGVAVIVMVLYPVEAAAFFTAVGGRGVLGSDEVMYVGKCYIFVLSVLF